MSTDDVQKAWRSQPGMTVDTEQLVQEMQHAHRSFTVTIFWRDVREVGVALLLVPVWIALGSYRNSHWTWYLAIPGLLWIAGFMVVDRYRQGRRRSAFAVSLRTGVERALADIDHQIWLLRNVHWWYLLPLTLPLLAYLGHSATRDGWAIIAPAVVCIGVMGFVYWLNQRAVDRQLQPMRNDMQQLLASLEVEEPAAAQGNRE